MAHGHAGCSGSCGKSCAHNNISLPATFIADIDVGLSTHDSFWVRSRWNKPCCEGPDTYRIKVPCIDFDAMAQYEHGPVDYVILKMSEAIMRHQEDKQTAGACSLQ